MSIYQSPNFHPQRVAATFKAADGLTPATASTIVSEFIGCPECDSALNTQALDAQVSDKDVVWATEYDASAPHHCSDCGTALDILVEEKAVGIIPESDVPVVSDSSLYFIPLEDGQSSSEVLVVNVAQIFLATLNKTKAPTEE